jgi:hypothetical protein
MMSSFAKVRLLFWLILYYVTEFIDLNNLYYILEIPISKNRFVSLA